MYRYIALYWNPRSGRDNQAAAHLRDAIKSRDQKWQTVTELPGFTILHQPDLKEGMDIVQESPATFLLGRVQHRHGNAPLAQGAAASSIEPLSAVTLARQRWGDYIAAFYQQEPGCLSIFRSPCGVLPCYYIQYNDIFVIFSDINDLIFYLAGTLSISRDYIIRKINHVEVDCHKTGINEVHQLLPGETLVFHRGKVSVEWAWRPNDLYNDEPIQDYQCAKTEVHNALVETIKSMFGPFDGALLWLSGGLDSSLLAALLQKVAPEKKVVCVNNHYTDGAGDERSLARLAAIKSGYTLIERTLDPKNSRLDILEKIKPSELLGSYHYEIDYLESDLDICSRHGLDGLFSGLLGDTVFYSFSARGVIDDYLLECRPDATLLTLCYHAAVREGSTIFEVIADSLARRYSRSRKAGSGEQSPNHWASSLCPADLLKQLPDIDMRHLEAVVKQNLPPGKVPQLSSIFTNTIFYPATDRSYDVWLRAPFSAQPVFEACLRIPTYLLTDRGKCRGLIRDLYQDLLPPEIWRRQAKGTSNSYDRQFTSHHRKFLKSYLSEGILLSAGVIQEGVIAEVLSDPERQPTKNIHDILNAFHIETWLRSFKRAGVSAIH